MSRPDNRGGDAEVEVDTPQGPAIAIAMHLGPSWAEHVDWLHQRYADDDGLGYDRAALAAASSTAHMARGSRA